MPFLLFQRLSWNLQSTLHAIEHVHLLQLETFYKLHRFRRCTFRGRSLLISCDGRPVTSIRNHSDEQKKPSLFEDLIFP